MGNIRSTFPLDETAIRRRVLLTIFGDPITWIPFIPGVAAYTIFQFPLFVGLGLCALAAAWLGRYWYSQWDALCRKYREEAAAEHNQQQDAALADAQRELTGLGCRDYAKRLGDFLALKKELETRIHQDGPPAAEGIQLDRLVDGLCFEARDRLLELGQRRARAVKAPEDEAEVLAKVEAAREVLANAAAHIETLLGGGDPLRENTAGLEAITQRLQEEMDMARRVQERLRNANASIDPELAPTPPPASQAQPDERERTAELKNENEPNTGAVRNG